MVDRFQMVRWALLVLVLSVSVNGVLVWWTGRVPAEPLILVEPTVAPTPTPAPLTVYVSGAVRRPGVYEIPSGSRVVDAVAAAGGLTDEAVPEAINQAAPLQDGVQVHVPSQEELSAGAHVAPPTNLSRPDEPGGAVNINTAGEDELEALPGIGPTLAARIVEYRTVNGPFTTVDELKQVKGIGDKLLERLRPYVTVGP
ncbi:MAG: ComEA family DNA-binding protein [Ardenticatenia bacterium]|nr:ComEA family DNA-binding protein [Ardenticatenia bacterium]